MSITTNRMLLNIVEKRISLVPKKNTYSISFGIHFQFRKSCLNILLASSLHINSAFIWFQNFNNLFSTLADQIAVKNKFSCIVIKSTQQKKQTFDPITQNKLWDLLLSCFSKIQTKKYIFLIFFSYHIFHNSSQLSLCFISFFIEVKKTAILIDQL